MVCSVCHDGDQVQQKPACGIEEAGGHLWLPGHRDTSNVEVLDMPSNTCEEVGEMSTSRPALSSGVVTFNS